LHPADLKLPGEKMIIVVIPETAEYISMPIKHCRKQ
jgi:hypothetical protein